MGNTGVVETGRNMKVLDLVYIAIGAALIAICSWISIPTAVPIPVGSPKSRYLSVSPRSAPAINTPI